MLDGLNNTPTAAASSHACLWVKTGGLKLLLGTVLERQPTLNGHPDCLDAPLDSPVEGCNG
jgi:L-ascorbate metabolism protein UlaG (beta-lactamase superfamily)